MKKIFSVLLIATLFIFSSEDNVDAYSDVNITKEQGIAVESLTTQSIMNGYIDDTFKPNAPATRAEVAKVLAIAKGLDLQNVTDPGFADVPQNHPYYAFIAALANNNIASGSNNKFNPNQTVTRGQVSKMLVRTFDLKGTKKMPFKDANSSGFKNEITSMYANAITVGISSTAFGINKPVTRGQLALFIHRIQKLQNPSPLNGVWNGYYYTSNGTKTSLILTIEQNTAVFNFKTPSGISGVSSATLDFNEETGVFKTVDKKWHIHPSGFSLGNLEGTLTPNNYLSGFFLFDSSATTFELQNEKSYPQDATVHLNGTWKGTGQMSSNQIQSAVYTFNNSVGTYTFGPTSEFPNIKTGSYAFSVSTSNSGLFKITPKSWIERPNSYYYTEATAVITNKNYILGYSEQNSSSRILVEKQ